MEHYWPNKVHIHRAMQYPKLGLLFQLEQLKTLKNISCRWLHKKNSITTLFTRTELKHFFLGPFQWWNRGRIVCEYCCRLIILTRMSGETLTGAGSDAIFAGLLKNLLWLVWIVKAKTRKVYTRTGQHSFNNLTKSNLSVRHLWQPWSVTDRRCCRNARALGQRSGNALDWKGKSASFYFSIVRIIF